MRIAYDARYVNDRYHGIGRYAFHLLEALAGAAPQHTLIVFLGRGRNTRFALEDLSRYPNVEFCAGPWPLYWPTEQLQWPLRLKAARADLFYSPYFVAPLLASTPALITVHDLIFEHYPQMMPLRWSRPYYRFLMQAGVRRARRVITVSQATASDLQSHYGAAAGMAVVTGEGADERFKPVEDAHQLAAVLERYGLRQPFFLSVGARRPHKNLALLVRAFGRLAGQIPHQLVFAGAADRRFPDEARQAAAAQGLEGRVQFLDWVPEGDLPALYSLAQAVVIPSLIEGFGLPALEAMACGTPVAASNHPALAEVVGASGLLFDPLDEAGLTQALARLAADAGLRAALRQAGLRRSASFTWHEAAARALQAIEAAHSPLPALKKDRLTDNAHPANHIRPA